MARKISGALGSKRSQNIDRLTKTIEARGGQNQLIMLVIDLEGTGKVTRINVTQRFSFEFYKEVSSMWRDTAFSSLHTQVLLLQCLGGLTTSSVIVLG